MWFIHWNPNDSDFLTSFVAFQRPYGQNLHNHAKEPMSDKYPFTSHDDHKIRTFLNWDTLFPGKKKKTLKNSVFPNLDRHHWKILAVRSQKGNKIRSPLILPGFNMSMSIIPKGFLTNKCQNHGFIWVTGTPKSSISIGFSIINHPFWDITILGNTHMTRTKMMMRLFQLGEHASAWVSSCCCLATECKFLGTQDI